MRGGESIFSTEEILCQKERVCMGGRGIEGAAGGKVTRRKSALFAQRRSREDPENPGAGGQRCGIRATKSFLQGAKEKAFAQVKRENRRCAQRGGHFFLECAKKGRSDLLRKRTSEKSYRLPVWGRRSIGQGAGEEGCCYLLVEVP